VRITPSVLGRSDGKDRVVPHPSSEVGGPEKACTSEQSGWVRSIAVAQPPGLSRRAGQSLAADRSRPRSVRQGAGVGCQLARRGLVRHVIGPWPLPSRASIFTTSWDATVGGPRHGGRVLRAFRWLSGREREARRPCLGS
jgi:hypothetical protein